jgi:hypothetical protein
LDAFLQRRLEASAAQNQMKESGVHVSKQYSNKQNKFAGEHRVMGQEVEADSDVSIIGFILQQRLPELLDFLSNESATLRYAALLLLGTLLRQGMLCPLDLIGKLIGLQGDPDYLIRGEALRIIQTEDERRSMFLDNRMLEGIEAALAHQLSVIQAPKALDDFSEKVDCGEDWLVNLIREMLHGRSGGNETNKVVLQRRAVSEQHCKKLVDCLVEMLLKTEEDNTAIMSQIEGKRTKSLHVDLIIHTIALFSEVRVVNFWNELIIYRLFATCNRPTLRW